MARNSEQDIPVAVDEWVIIYSCTGDYIYPGIIICTSWPDKQVHNLFITLDETVEVDTNSVTIAGHTIAYQEMPHSIYVSNDTCLRLALDGCPPLDDIKNIQSSPLWLHDLSMSQ